MNLIEQVLEKNVTRVDPKELAKAPSLLKQIDEKLKWAEEQKAELFGFEKLAHDQINTLITDLNKEKTRLTTGMGHFGYGCLDTAPLKWRDKKGYPKLALFSLDSPTFSINGKGLWRDRWVNVPYDVPGLWGPRKSSRVQWEQNVVADSWSVEPKLPGKLAQFYKDVGQKMMKLVDEKQEDVFLSCSYSGTIPTETRAKIRENQPRFKQLFIMSEAKDWKITTQRVKTPVELYDPLLLGWDGDDLWVIDHFELTSIERLVASQFTK